MTSREDTDESIAHGGPPLCTSTATHTTGRCVLSTKCPIRVRDMWKLHRIRATSFVSVSPCRARWRPTTGTATKSTHSKRSLESGAARRIHEEGRFRYSGFDPRQPDADL